MSSFLMMPALGKGRGFCLSLTLPEAALVDSSLCIILQDDSPSHAKPGKKKEAKWSAIRCLLVVDLVYRSWFFKAVCLGCV